jgi:hypothetical protein
MRVPLFVVQIIRVVDLSRLAGHQGHLALLLFIRDALVTCVAIFVVGVINGECVPF